MAVLHRFYCMFTFINLFQSIDAIRQVVDTIFLLYPNYCLGTGLMDIAFNHYQNELYSHTGMYYMAIGSM